MLKRRVTESLRVVSLADPALDPIPTDALKQYESDRNFASLDLTACSDKPTIFHCRPLRPEFEYALSNVDQGSLWLLFREHVEAIENFDPGSTNIWEPGHRRQLKDDARSVFAPELVQEIASVIVQAASRYDSRPFTPLGSWQRDRIQRRSRVAMSAPIDGAIERTSDS